MANRPADWVTPFDPPVHDDHIAPQVFTIPEPQDMHRPFSPMQALMETAPGNEPDISKLELIAYRDILADALDDLEPRDRRLIEARVIEKVPLRQLEQELGWRKSYMHRREKWLLRRLANELKKIPAIQEYLHRHEQA